VKPRDRVWAALRGEPVDRPPVSFWGHLYDRESSAQDLVEATAELQRQHGWDWVKLNPRKHYHVEDWGVRYRYSGRREEKPTLEQWPIHGPEDWAQVAERTPDRGALAEQVEAVRMLKRSLPTNVPFVQTVFSPLAVLAEMVAEPKVLKSHLATHPERVRTALEAVTTTYQGFVRRLLEAGADGIFFATTDWGSRNWMSPDEHRQWARPYDLRVLAAAEGAPFNVLHVCKSRNLLLELADYPVQAFSYDATDPTNPSLAEALARLGGAVMGGVSQENALQQATPDAVRAEVVRGYGQTGGRRWLVAPGCSIPPTTPPANLGAVRAAVAEGQPVSAPAGGGFRAGPPSQEVPR
jgi:uroporphyrinogen decarboxylase